LIFIHSLERFCSYLHPLAGTFLFVTAIALLRDNAFQTLLLRRLEQLETSVGKVLRKTVRLIGGQDLTQQFLALFKVDAQ
jgi:hypothetical protein